MNSTENKSEDKKTEISVVLFPESAKYISVSNEWAQRLEAAGIKAITAETADQAVELAKENKARYIGIFAEKTPESYKDDGFEYLKTLFCDVPVYLFRQEEGQDTAYRVSTAGVFELVSEATPVSIAKDNGAAVKTDGIAAANDGTPVYAVTNDISMLQRRTRRGCVTILMILALSIIVLSVMSGEFLPILEWCGMKNTAAYVLLPKAITLLMIF